MLRRKLIRFTWGWAVVFLPAETYVTYVTSSGEQPLIVLSGYIVNVLGVGVMLWGAVSMKKGLPYAEGLLATGWAWTTAVFWRATNLRYWFAGEGEELSFGQTELWLAPVFTMLAAAALVGSLVLLVRSRQHSDG